MTCLCPFLSCLSRAGDYKYKRGTTGVLSRVETPVSLEVVEETIQTMDTS